MHKSVSGVDEWIPIFRARNTSCGADKIFQRYPPAYTWEYAVVTFSSLSIFESSIKQPDSYRYRGSARLTGRALLSIVNFIHLWHIRRGYYHDLSTRGYAAANSIAHVHLTLNCWVYSTCAGETGLHVGALRFRHQLSWFAIWKNEPLLCIGGEAK